MNDSDFSVLTVNGEPVYSQEFKLIMGDNIPIIYSYFKTKHGVEGTKDFWTTNFEGEKPLEFLKKKTLDKVIEIKTEQILCKKKGIIKDISYPVFLESLKNENNLRKEKIKKGQVIYGPQEYGEKEYFFYLLSNQIIDLKDELLQTDFAIRDEALKKLYEEQKNSEFVKPPQMKVEVLGLIWNAKNTNAGYYAFKEEVRLADEKLKANVSIKEISDYFSKKANMKIKLSEVKIDENNIKTGADEFYEAWSQMVKLKMGEKGSNYNENGDYYIYKCIEKLSTGYRPFEEVKDAVKSNYINEKFSELLHRTKSQAKVEIISENYERITVD